MKRWIKNFIKVAVAASLVLIVFSFVTATSYAVDKTSAEHFTYLPPTLANHSPRTRSNETSTEYNHDSPRRNLSEYSSSGYNQSHTDKAISGIQDPALAPPEKQHPPEQLNTDQRPSGVVYQYIPPPPINLTARIQLSYQFPHLANLSSPTSAALCGIVKDAENYLDEWVDYHFGLGFHTIYLIDNSDNHELLSWQNKRRQRGYSVRVLPKPGTHRQMYGYHMCASEFKEMHTYMAFFDVDEFLVLKNHTNVHEFLVKYLPKGSLAISWFVFGSGNTTMYSPLPVTKRFVYRDGTDVDDRHPIWYNVKSILKLNDYGGYPQSPHSMKTNRRTAGSDKAWRDTNGSGSFDKIGASNYDRPVDVAVLHHYKYLSPKEFHHKSCVRKTVDDLYKDCNSQTKNMIPLYVGKVFDDSAWQALKKNVPKYAMYDKFEDFM